MQRSFFKPIWALSKVTWSEILRDRVLYNILLTCLALLFTAFLLSQFTYSANEKILFDVGLVALQLSCSFVAIFTGAAMMGREYERRTVWVSLSRPITKHQFVIGKYFGLVHILFLNWFLLSVIFLGVLALVSSQGDFSANLIWSPTLVGAIILVFFQSLFLGACAVLFSSKVTTALAVILSIGVYLIGNCVTQVKVFSQKIEDQTLALFLKYLSQVLPNLEYYQLGERASYGLSVSLSYYLASLVYTALAVIFCLILAGVILEKREQ